ncbi:MAG: type II toxin-antitoxin system HipA family toxin [Planctomycetota bacterium]|jgi:serine/threonine-protein kinase HipA
MSTFAEVRLWGSTIGAVFLADGEDVATFEYDADFLRSGIQLSPLKMPLTRSLYRFPELARQSFHGLPGLLADSLPDRFGNALIDAWLASQGRAAHGFNAVERLCYTGTRGMGALEFAPARGPAARRAQAIEVQELVDLATEILTDRTVMQGSFDETTKAEALKQILQVGTSAGGARAKAVIAWNPETQEVRSGQVSADPGFEHWLLKFDGVGGNRDKELEDPKGYGLIEYAYHLMAVDAGIRMHPCRLLKENGRSHFMTRRFDRTGEGDKLHMQSLGALAHFDFNQAGAHGYEQAFQVLRSLDCSPDDLEEQFRRMAFNILARNQDDHVKNIAYLMDRAGRWSLAPAFDVTYSYAPSGAWTSRHQMSMNGKRDGFLLDDFILCAKTAGLKRGRAETIVGEVHEIVRSWEAYAERTGVEEGQREGIRRALRLEIVESSPPTPGSSGSR